MPQMIAILTPQPLLQENVAFVFLKSLCEMPTKLVEYLLLIRIHILTKKSRKKKKCTRENWLNAIKENGEC